LNVSTIHFEDLEIGKPIAVGTWSISRDDAIAFARTWEPQPYHVDESAAKASIYGGLTVCSLYLFALCTRLFFDYRPPLAVVGMLGKDRITLPQPARPGDTLTYTTTCVEKRPSRTKPDRGVVTLHDTLATQAGDVVLNQQVTLLVLRRTSQTRGRP
jgi:acyl dehydratase